MGALEGRVAVITGAGRGIGREHALLFAREGAAVVVNDLGGSNAGEGADAGPAHEVADEIIAAGGQAVANTDNVRDWDGAKALVDQAIDEFGRLDVVVNNAGILRDAFIAGMDGGAMGRGDRGAPEGPLRGAAARRRVLEGAVQGGQPAQRRGDQHRLGVGHDAAQRRPGQLRRRQGGYRRADPGRRR